MDKAIHVKACIATLHRKAHGMDKIHLDRYRQHTRSNPDLGTGTCENTFLYKQKNKMPSVLYFIFSTISAIDPSPPPPTPHPIHKGRFSPSMKRLTNRLGYKASQQFSKPDRRPGIYKARPFSPSGHDVPKNGETTRAQPCPP